MTGRAPPTLDGALIVSCQPVPGSPLDTDAFVEAVATAVAGVGARGLRIEGIERVRCVARAVELPVIGIVKRAVPNDRLFITPTLEDVDALVEAGAAIIAFDATERQRPVPLARLIGRIHEKGRLAMADCATFEEGRDAKRLGADFIGSTLAGYTGGGPPPTTPDLALLRRWRGEGIGPVIAEGNIRTPADAAAARAAGAAAVVVGSAITRPEHVTAWFLEAMAG